MGSPSRTLRTRKQLVRERASHVQRLQKTLDDAKIKLDSAISDIVGLTGHAILEAIVCGESDPAKLCRSGPSADQDAAGRIARGAPRPDHVTPWFSAASGSWRINALDGSLNAIDREVDKSIEPFAPPSNSSSPSPEQPKSVRALLPRKLART
jgi:transposase